MSEDFFKSPSERAREKRARMETTRKPYTSQRRPEPEDTRTPAVISRERIKECAEILPRPDIKKIYEQYYFKFTRDGIEAQVIGRNYSSNKNLIYDAVIELRVNLKKVYESWADGEDVGYSSSELEYVRNSCIYFATQSLRKVMPNLSPYKFSVEVLDTAASEGRVTIQCRLNDKAESVIRDSYGRLSGIYAPALSDSLLD